jgi:hypothetical protein
MSKRSPTTTARRLSLALATAAAALATTAILTTTGSAQTGQPTTLHLSTHSQKNIGFFPRHAPRPGDQIGFGDRITGDDTGIARTVCTIMNPKDPSFPCIVWMKLSNGTLTAQGFFPERAHTARVAITGGTGAYDGARGTALATDITQTSSRITIQLLP